MPDNEFTRALLEATEVLKNVANSLAFSNWMLNYLMQGSITFLWGLINCLQILSYLPLINVAMPANAHIVFMIIVKIANFEILDNIDEVVDEIELQTELKDADSNKYIISDSFSDFGF